MAKRQPLRKLFTVYPQKHGADCGIAALAMALNISYEDVLVVAARIIPTVLTVGLTSVEMAVIAGQLHKSFSIKEPVDVMKDTGILSVKYANGEEHAVFLTRGLVFEPTSGGDVWDVKHYLKHNKCKAMDILIEEV